MTIETTQICIRCGAVGEDMDFDSHINGFVCDRCANKQELYILSK